MIPLSVNDTSSVDALAGIFRSLAGSLLEIYVLEADRITWERALHVVAGRASIVEFLGSSGIAVQLRL